MLVDKILESGCLGALFEYLKLIERLMWSSNDVVFGLPRWAMS
jgi:hypothetical protein